MILKTNVGDRTTTVTTKAALVELAIIRSLIFLHKNYLLKNF
jgi:hypothetical protein